VARLLCADPDGLLATTVGGRIDRHALVKRHRSSRDGRHALTRDDNPHEVQRIGG
jgi:hypothetical protein